MKSKSLRWLKVFVALFIAVESLALAFFMRPIQDDYFNLQSVRQLGLFGNLSDIWNSHGGNMVQFFIHGVVILPTTQSFVFWNLGLFFLLTEVLVFFAVRSIILWLLTHQNSKLGFWVPLLSVAGFEGLFVPGFLGAYGFSLATLAHLWPVMALIFGLIALKNFPGSWVFALLLGLIAGNSNLGESAFACGAWLLILMLGRVSPSKLMQLHFTSGKNFYALGLGTFIGTLSIAAAPGFWNRASDQVGLPSSPTDFFWRFGRSLASFTADGLSHPMVWVLFLLGAFLVRTGQLSRNEIFDLKLKVLLAGTFLIWLALILGSTFAYPAWHQSMGMYVLMLPASFGAGLYFGLKLDIKNVKILLAISTLVMILVFARIGVLGVSRSLAWDKNLESNICLIKNDSKAKLLGAEIQYPPFYLGVDDVNTWEWMRNKYAGWVSQVPNQVSCKSD